MKIMKNEKNRISYFSIHDIVFKYHNASIK